MEYGNRADGKWFHYQPHSNFHKAKFYAHFQQNLTDLNFTEFTLLPNNYSYGCTFFLCAVLLQLVLFSYSSLAPLISQLLQITENLHHWWHLWLNPLTNLPGPYQFNYVRVIVTLPLISHSFTHCYHGNVLHNHGSV